MLQFDIITIFPEIFDSYFKESLIKRAVARKLLKVRIHNLRDWARDKHKTVDDRPFGGGRGMVMKVEPIYKAVEDLKINNKKSKVVLFTPRGKRFSQRLAWDFSRYDQLILICGRYEGVDERVSKHIADIELSIGDYVLMGGELPSLVLLETVARLLPGVLGKSELLAERITGQKGFIEYPQYTRPELFFPPPSSRLPPSPGLRRTSRRTNPPSPGLRRTSKTGIAWQVPKVLISGDHKKIADWRKNHSKIIEK